MPRIFLHYLPLLGGVKGNEGLGLAGFCLRLRADWRTNMTTLLMTTGIGDSCNSGVRSRPVVVKVVVHGFRACDDLAMEVVSGLFTAG
ncbi:MAG: hypothetical protein NTU94_07140 [Planctomycetota bacterium]|nr:hypothetical protein [Planctomycetota bacterium]